MFRKLLISLALALPCVSQATVVEFRTVMGDVQVNLFDETTPETVQNFLDYVNSGAYANNIIHRSEPGFVIQGGGFQYNDVLPLDAVPTGTPVVNEPALSNVAGTIAMAKLSGDPNSATSQWFFNMANNSANLDVQNSGFTVFGQVLGDGFEVLQAIEALPRFNLGGAAGSAPLRDYTATDASNSVEPNGDNFVIINDIVVIDDATVTNPDLVPVPNTLLNNNDSGGSSGDSDSSGSGGSSGGGSTSHWLLAMLVLPVLLRRRKQ
ncbi:MAG: peptidylprolyl isomerase [Alteromonadaceae bacterium]|nr:peptidylprolyl isomerase [Alteromonadaceae bacterium]